jgi:hypothetical protein
VELDPEPELGEVEPEVVVGEEAPLVDPELVLPLVDEELPEPLDVLPEVSVLEGEVPVPLCPPPEVAVAEPSEEVGPLAPALAGCVEEELDGGGPGRTRVCGAMIDVCVVFAAGLDGALGTGARELPVPAEAPADCDEDELTATLAAVPDGV